MTVIGSADQDILSSFAAKWQSGRVTDLEAGLAQVRNRSTTSSNRPAGERRGNDRQTLTAAARRPVSQRRPARRRTRRYGSVALFMSPWIIGFSVFILYPMIASLYYSFTNYDLLEDPTWVGWQNYRFMFTKDPQFWIAMRNTLWIIAIGVPLQILTALSLGWLLTRPKRGSRVYRTACSCRRWSRPSRPPSGSCSCSTRDRPDQPGPPGARRARPAAVVLQPVLVEVGPGVPGLWGSARR